MNRRVFLRETVMGAGVIACGVGGLWVRRWRARGQVMHQLMDSARPILDKHALEEQELPEREAEGIRRYFDQMCLNVEGYIGEISTPEFRQKLSIMPTSERRHHELLTVFYRRVEGADRVGEEFHTRTQKIGHELDRHWSECIAEIATQWQVRLKESKGPAFDTKAFSENVVSQVSAQVEQAVRRSHHVTEEPGWREAIRERGAEALLASEQVKFDLGDHTIEVPEYVLSASRRALGQLLDFLGDAQWDCHKWITARLAVLGNQAAAQFVKEIRRHLNDLHSWREQAIRLAAEQQAVERIGFFGEHG
jgi:hypothetical protein